MKKAFLFLLVTWLIACQSLTAQTSFLNSRSAYLGQPMPGDTPKIFAPGLLAVEGEFTANRTAISADGKEIYYCTNKTWKNSNDLKIKCFKYDGKKWVGPTIINEHMGQTSLSPDGQNLYFASFQSAGTVYRSRRTKTGWGDPETYIERNYVIYDFMPTRSGNKYAASNGTWGSPSDANAMKFSVMPASDADTSIQNLGSPLNAEGFNGDFFVAPDESYMVISTNETEHFECELYISFRKEDKSWTKPESLGPLINDGLAHRYGQYVSPDGKFLFYTRGETEKDCAVYWVRFDRLLKKLKQESLKG
jgi:hypothetical protein